MDRAIGRRPIDPPPDIRRPKPRGSNDSPVAMCPACCCEDFRVIEVVNAWNRIVCFVECNHCGEPFTYRDPKPPKVKLVVKLRCDRCRSKRLLITTTPESDRRWHKCKDCGWTCPSREVSPDDI